MAKNECFITAAPERVFAVLADAYSYDRWVVGTKEIRDADQAWPEPGTRLHHSVGLGPFTLHDNTEVVTSEPPRHLRLEARGRPFGRALIDFSLTAFGDGTQVQILERVIKPRPLAALNPLLAPLVKLRNTETLRRLTSVVLSSTPTDH